MKIIDIIGKDVGMNPQFEKFEHTLENMQKRVKEDGATLDVVRLDGDIDMWVDDEGLLNGSKPNLLMARNGEVIAQINGNVFFASADEEGETIGLTDEQKICVMHSIRISKGKRLDGTEGFLYILYIDILSDLTSKLIAKA